ncbi:MAG: adenylate/guanylate cyclase domain-containing protein [Tistlia sp.]|uniref:adenylate/guanylate cyclase domain-containing protein n=1 Tax=Tistlia sp. TaxID=3057121 RepID=UPI0034A5A147
MSGVAPDKLAQWGVASLNRVSRAVLFVDRVESVRLIDADEEAVLRHWLGFVSAVSGGLVPKHGGRVVKSLGDGLFAEFPTPEAAVAAAFAIQRLSDESNRAAPDEPQILLRMGIDAGDVVESDADLYGRRVNVAARLMGVAEPGEIVTSAGVRDALSSELDAEFEDLGDCYLRHLSRPVRAYRVRPPGHHPRLRPLLQETHLLPTVAVVPFIPRRRTLDPAALGEVLAEDIIVALARSHELNVISRLSTRVFRTRSTSLEGMGEALHADFVVSGTYVSDDRKVVLDVELAEVRSGNVLSVQRLTDRLDHILKEEQGAISQLVADIRKAILRREVQRAQSRPRPSLESYTLLMSAIELMHRLSPHDFLMARSLLEALLERTPRHPLPQAWMARWHVLRVQQGWSDERSRDSYLALDCTRRALDTDPDNPLALVMEGFVHTNLLKQLDVGEQRYHSALESSPSDPLGRLLLGTLHAFRGEGSQAVRETEHARLLTPLDPHRFFYDSLSASACIAAEDYGRALELAQRSLRANRNHTSTLRVKAVAQWRLGLEAEARQTARDLTTLEPKLTVRGWLEGSPSAAYPVGEAFARTLREVGVPE